MSQVVTDSELREIVRDSDVPVLAKFFSPWCGPCRVLGPVITEVEKRFSGRLKVVALNVVDHPAAQTRLGLPGVPTCILYVDGAEKARIIGAQPERQIVATVEPHLPAKAPVRDDGPPSVLQRRNA